MRKRFTQRVEQGRHPFTIDTENIIMNAQIKPLLQPTPPAADTARVEAIFKGISERFGFVPDGLRLYSISPELLENFLANVGYFMAHQSLSQKLLAMIRYLASVRVECPFCIDFNEAYLDQLGADLDQVRAAREDLDQAPLEAKELILLRLALKGIETPDTVVEEDLTAARAQGWSDRDIFDVVAIAANNRSFTTLLKTFKVEHQGAYA